MKIIIYGNGDKSKETGFLSESDFVAYIEGEIFTRFGGRYRYRQRRHADIIVLSREGKPYGYFVVSEIEDPTDEDNRLAKNVRMIYVIKESVLFQKPVVLKTIGIAGIQFGKTINKEQFEEVKLLAGIKGISKYN